jgi:hypothetical protein
MTELMHSQAQARDANMLHAAIRQAFLRLDAALPNSRILDRHFLRARFLRAHKRLPRSTSDPKATFNDLIFERMTKNSWTLLERFCIDKEYAKLFVVAQSSELRIPHTLAVINLENNSRREVVRSLLRFAGKPCVAKPTHGSGTVLFMSKRPSAQEMERFCADAGRSYYEQSRESQYKGLERKIIVEEDLSSDGQAPEDYKFFCARGQVLFCQIDVDRFTDHRRCLVNDAFEPIGVRYMYDEPPDAPQKPENFDEMVRIAGRLSRQFRFVRVDLYSVGGKAYFGELTFAPEGGAGALSDEAFGIETMQRIREADAPQVLS